MRLTPGKRYPDHANFLFLGWVRGDEPVPDLASAGYNVAHYFAADGTYRGPDEFGVEPDLALPFVRRCAWQTDATNRCERPGTHRLLDNAGKTVPMSPVCEEHGRKIVEEYQTGLGWHWTLEPVDAPSTDEGRAG